MIFEGTLVAFVRRCPVMGYSAFKVGFFALEMVAGRTFPNIKVRSVGEPAIAITLRAVMGVARSEFQNDGDTD